MINRPRPPNQNYSPARIDQTGTPQKCTVRLTIRAAFIDWRGPEHGLLPLFQQVGHVGNARCWSFQTIEVAMRRLNGTELAALALAILLLVLGLVMIARPSDELIFHGATRSFPPSIEFISKDRSRSYGTLAVLFGAGIVAMVFYRRHK
jgi:hypothetical protein